MGLIPSQRGPPSRNPLMSESPVHMYQNFQKLSVKNCISVSFVVLVRENPWLIPYLWDTAFGNLSKICGLFYLMHLLSAHSSSQICGEGGVGQENITAQHMGWTYDSFRIKYELFHSSRRQTPRI